MPTEFSQLRDLLAAKQWDPFIAASREHGIPDCVLALIVEGDRQWDPSPEGFLAPNVKPFLDLLGTYTPVAREMCRVANQRPPGDVLAMLLRGHALDYWAIPGEWQQMRDTMAPILKYWDPQALKPVLEDPQYGHAVAWCWLYRILYYAQYVTDHSEGLRGYQYMVGEALSKWQALVVQGSQSSTVAPEITEADTFGQSLARLLKEDPSIKTVLEVGASTGKGSTAILAKHIGERGSIIALEADPERYKELWKRFGSSGVVYPANQVVTNEICDYQTVMQFFMDNPDSPLCRYGLYEVLSWLQRDQARDPLIEIGIPAESDLVILDGSEFQGWEDFQRIHSESPSRYYALDDILTLKNKRVYDFLAEDPSYVLWDEDKTCRHGWAIFGIPDTSPWKILESLSKEENQSVVKESLTAQDPPESDALSSTTEKSSVVQDPTIKESLTVQDPVLPIRFFTIVLDGDPYIQQHLARFQQLSMPWEWWICEGVALHRHDSAWAQGGTIPMGYERGLSKDGTTEYLDSIKDPRIKIVRKELQYQFWDGKIEMVRAVGSPDHECLLWQVDADEIWDPETIERVYREFSEHPEYKSAQFFCNYYVGPNLTLGNRGCWGNNPEQEWWRVWRWDPSCQWLTHEPPTIARPKAEGDPDFVNVTTQQTAYWRCFFDHYAYATRPQVEFKEQYYGESYRGAAELWDQLQSAPKPCKLKPFMPWAYGDIDVFQVGGIPEFLRPIQPAQPYSKSRLVIDGIFFAKHKTGIARVWRSLIPELQSLGHEVFLIDRGGCEGIPVDLVPWPLEDDPPPITDACFLSTYYTHQPKGSRQVLLLHDMIPEIYGWDAPEWRQKRAAIEATGSLVCVSENTKRDLLRFYGRDAVVAYPGVDHNTFKPAANPDPKYWMLTGIFPNTYKNTEQFLSTRLSRLIPTVSTMTPQKGLLEGSHTITCAGYLTDEELAATYQGALALVYPSLYEGFGLPVLEAMACGIPVICNPVASLPEVGGNAAIYAHDGNMEAALAKVLDPSVRSMAINAGIQQASQFTWAKMAGILSEVIEHTKGDS